MPARTLIHTCTERGAQRVSKSLREAGRTVGVRPKVAVFFYQAGIFRAKAGIFGRQAHRLFTNAVNFRVGREVQCSWWRWRLIRVWWICHRGGVWWKGARDGRRGR
jgi:hypothetical protein